MRYESEETKILDGVDDIVIHFELGQDAIDVLDEYL